MSKKKRILKIILGSSSGLIIMFLIILIPVLMVLDFFGANITDNYGFTVAHILASKKIIPP